MKRSVIWSSSALIVVAGAMMLYVSMRDNAPSEAEPQASVPAGMSQSSDKVKVSATRVPAPASDMVLTLEIEEGWHVNATPPSMDFLIPTIVNTRVDGQAVEVPVIYPPGRTSDIVLDGTALEVYDDGAKITLSPDQAVGQTIASTDKLDIAVQVQSCDDSGICLAPSTIPVEMPKN